MISWREHSVQACRHPHNSICTSISSTHVRGKHHQAYDSGVKQQKKYILNSSLVSSLLPYIRCNNGSPGLPVTKRGAYVGEQGPVKDLKSRYTASALAFLGDAVWSMHVRRQYLLPPKHSTKYHDAVDKHSAAEMQAQYFDQLLDIKFSPDNTFSEPQGKPAEAVYEQFELTANERAIVQWALSKPTYYRQRFQGREEAQLAYQKASALEALIGYLALTNEARLGQLLATLMALLPKQ